MCPTPNGFAAYGPTWFGKYAAAGFVNGDGVAFEAESVGDVHRSDWFASVQSRAHILFQYPPSSVQTHSDESVLIDQS